MKLKEYQKLKENKNRTEKLLEKMNQEKEENKKKIEENKLNLTIFSKKTMKGGLIGIIIGMPLCFFTVGNCSLLSIFAVLGAGITSSVCIYLLEYLKNKPVREAIKELENECTGLDISIGIEQKFLNNTNKKLNSLTEEERRDLDEKLIEYEKEQKQIKSYFELGKNSKMTQDGQQSSREATREELWQKKAYLFEQKEQNINIVNRRLLELAYVLGTEVLPIDGYTQEEIKSCEEMLGLKISKKHIEKAN